MRDCTDRWHATQVSHVLHWYESTILRASCSFIFLWGIVISGPKDPVWRRIIISYGTFMPFVVLTCSQPLHPLYPLLSFSASLASDKHWLWDLYCSQNSHKENLSSLIPLTTSVLKLRDLLHPGSTSVQNYFSSVNISIILYLVCTARGTDTQVADNTFRQAPVLSALSITHSRIGFVSVFVPACMLASQERWSPDQVIFVHSYPPIWFNNRIIQGEQLPAFCPNQGLN